MHSTQKKRERINEKRRERYRQKKMDDFKQLCDEEKKKMDEEARRLKDIEQQLKQREEKLIEERQRLAQENRQQTDGVGMRSHDARRKALQRARHSMPRQAPNFVTTAVDVIVRASPMKAEALKRAGVRLLKPNEHNPEDAVMEAVAEGLVSRELSKRKLLATSLSNMKKFKLQRQASKRFGVSRKLLSKAKRFRAGRKSISASTVKQVEAFYERHSKQLPDKKLVSKKTNKARSILDKTLTELHFKYNQTNPNQQVSLSSFAALRPHHVKTKQQAKYVGCLCEYCENVQLKVNAINVHLSAISARGEHVKDIFQLSNITLCPKSDSADQFYHPSCIKRECDKCGIRLLKESSLLAPLFQEMDS